MQDLLSRGDEIGQVFEKHFRVQALCVAVCAAFPEQFGLEPITLHL